MILKIGQPGVLGRFEKYAQHFDLLELAAEPGKLPRRTRLRQWADRVLSGFAFSVVVPSRVAALEAAVLPADQLEVALDAAAALSAEWLVIRTPVGVTPDRRKRERLRVLAERLLGTGRRVAWEPHGPWVREQAEQFARSLGLTLALDAAQQGVPAGDAVYTRLRGLATAGRLRRGALQAWAGGMRAGPWRAPTPAGPRAL